MAWLQKSLFNPRTPCQAWTGEEQGVSTRALVLVGVCCQWPAPSWGFPLGISPPGWAGTSGCSSGTRTLTHAHVWGLGWLCAKQFLSAFASGCQTHSALSLNALPGHSGGSSAEELAGKLQLITETALATQGKNWNMLKKVLPQTSAKPHIKEQQDGSESSTHLKHTLRGKMLSFLTGLCFVKTQEIQTSPHEKG